MIFRFRMLSFVKSSPLARPMVSSLRDLKTCALVAITTQVAQRLLLPGRVSQIARTCASSTVTRPSGCHCRTVYCQLVKMIDEASLLRLSKTTASCALAGRHLMLPFLQETVLMGITMLNNSLLVKRLHTLSSLTRHTQLHVKLAAAVGG